MKLSSLAAVLAFAVISCETGKLIEHPTKDSQNLLMGGAISGDVTATEKDGYDFLRNETSFPLEFAAMVKPSAGKVVTLHVGARSHSIDGRKGSDVSITGVLAPTQSVALHHQPGGASIHWTLTSVVLKGAPSESNVLGKPMTGKIADDQSVDIHHHDTGRSAFLLWVDPQGPQHIETPSREVMMDGRGIDGGVLVGLVERGNKVAIAGAGAYALHAILPLTNHR